MGLKNVDPDSGSSVISGVRVGRYHSKCFMYWHADASGCKVICFMVEAATSSDCKFCGACYDMMAFVMTSRWLENVGTCVKL